MPKKGRFLQVLTTLLYGISGGMKAFRFDKVSDRVPSFGALPRKFRLRARQILRDHAHRP